MTRRQQVLRRPQDHQDQRRGPPADGPHQALLRRRRRATSWRGALCGARPTPSPSPAAASASPTYPRISHDLKEASPSPRLRSTPITGSPPTRAPDAKSLFSAGTPGRASSRAEDQRALDYLAARPDVDPARIGCAGLSGGGLRTVFSPPRRPHPLRLLVGMMTTWRDYLLNKIVQPHWMVYIPGCRSTSTIRGAGVRVRCRHWS